MDDIDEVLYTVGEVAALFRITVRTLHHWEAQGLLSPHVAQLVQLPAIYRGGLCPGAEDSDLPRYWYEIDRY